jgi:predicted small secreted protein
MKNNRFMLACVALLALSACNTMKKELGVGRNSPDEFMVVKRAPLSLPPDYSLRPPSDSDVAPASDASNQAKALLMGEGAEETAASGGSENALLDQMGAEKANPEIRSIINEENGYIAVKNEKLVDKLIFWKDEQDQGISDDDLDSSVVNPGQEAERLKKNEEEGRPVNEGKVPTIEKKKGTIDKLF